MNINVLVVVLLGSLIGFYSWKSFFRVSDEAPSQLPWVPIDANKHRSFVNQTRDAGMFVERSRRLAIIGAGCAGPKFGYKGSTNGSLEYYFLSGLCPVAPKDVCPPAPNVILSSGDADDEICDIIDAGGAGGMYDTLDFGGAGGNVCDV